MPGAAIVSQNTFLRGDDAPVAWAASPGLVDYPSAVATMEARARAIADGEAGELVWLLEHPPLYSAGVSAKPADLLTPDRFPVFPTGRGGQFTYHGPGQRVAYVILDLGARRRDARAFVAALEAWVITALAWLGVESRVSPGRIGVWAAGAAGGGDEKIAAIGVRLKRWVSFHGISLNVAPDLEHFTGIIPCGLRDAGVTSLRRLGVSAGMGETDSALRAAFTRVFGRTVEAPPPL